MSMLPIKALIAGDDFVTETVLTGLALNEDLSHYYIAAQSEKRCNELRKKYNINAVTDFNEFIDKTGVLILTCKAKDARDTFGNLAQKINKDTIIISVVGGIAMVFIQNFFPDNAVIRLTMNPSIISGEGIGAYIAGPKATEESKSIAHNILSSFGKIVEVKDEDEFEKARNFILANTFLSYVVVKSMVEAGKKIGFDVEQIGEVVDQILKGASRTLIKFQVDGGDMLRDGLKNTNVTNHAIDLIRSYGIYDSIERYLTQKELSATLFDSYDDDIWADFENVLKLK